MKVVRPAMLHLSVGNSSVHAEATRAGVVIWAGEAAYESPDDLAEVIAGLAAAPAERCPRVWVTLERPPAQTRTLNDLPPVRDRELAALVANQAGRFFRRNGATLVTDAIWVANGNGRVTHAVAVEEPLVLAIVAGAREAGLVVERITVAGVAPELQLLPTAERAVRERVRRRLLLHLGVAVLAVWLAAGLGFGARLIVERRNVETELAAAQTPLAALREVRLEMRSAEAMVQQLADARRSRGQALATLAAVNAALPDSAVVTSYTWRSDGSGVIAGAGRRGADVLAAIERARTVPAARLEGPIVRDVLAGHEWERFTILFGARNP
jgi:cell division protein FtsB